MLFCNLEMGRVGGCVIVCVSVCVEGVKGAGGGSVQAILQFRNFGPS